MSSIADSLSRLDVAIEGLDSAVATLTSQAQDRQVAHADYLRLNNVLRAEIAEVIHELDQILVRERG